MLAKFTFLLLASALFAHTSPTPAGDPAPSKRPRLEGAQESGVPCADYAQCGIKGKFYWKQLINQIQLPNPTVDVDRSQVFEDWYGASHEVRDGAGDEISDELVKHQLSPIENYHNWYVFARLQEGGEEDMENNPYRNLINTKDGVIIATYNYRDQDKAQKLKWSDIIYESYIRELEEEDQPGQSIADLRTVINIDVINAGTINVARAAYKSINIDFNGNSDWIKWTVAETPYW